MRFRFCGDLDCPDWVLAEISTLSKIPIFIKIKTLLKIGKHFNVGLKTSVKMKLLCVQVIKDMLGQGIDYDKVYKITSDAKFEEGDVKASIAALHFVIASAAKYSVDGDSLSNELQQLGLPKEHSTSLCKSYSDNLVKLHEQFRKDSLRLSQLEGVEWRVDYLISSSHLKDIGEPCVQLKMKVKQAESGQTEPVSFTVSSDKFRVLLNELKHASAAMDNLGTS